MHVLARLGALRLSGIFGVLTVSSLVGCGDRGSPGSAHECAPSCQASCGPDGCGGTCPCPDDRVRNGEGTWVPRDQCRDTCVALGWACGSLCGESCGECPTGQRCVEAFCEGKAAWFATGSTEACRLRLSVVRTSEIGGRYFAELEVVLDPGEVGPSLLDLHLRADAPIEVLEASLAALSRARGAKLVPDPDGNPWYKLSSRAVRIVSRLDPAARDGLAIKLVLGTSASETTRIWIERKAHILAPFEADAALQSCAYEAPVAVGL